MERRGWPRRGAARADLAVVSDELPPWWPDDLADAGDEWGPADTAERIARAEAESLAG